MKRAGAFGDGHAPLIELDLNLITLARHCLDFGHDLAAFKGFQGENPPLAIIIPASGDNARGGPGTDIFSTQKGSSEIVVFCILVPRIIVGWSQLLLDEIGSPLYNKRCGNLYEIEE